MIFLETLIMDILKLKLPNNVHVLGTVPLDSDPNNNQDSLIALSLQPTPSVHVFEKSFTVLTDDVLNQQYYENPLKLKKSKQVWIVIVIQNPQELQNSPKYAYEELERLKCMVQKILTYWNPNKNPFIIPLAWNVEPVENLYHAYIGYVYCPMIIETSRPYYETIERIP
jgi:hypothetical protein